MDARADNSLFAATHPAITPNANSAAPIAKPLADNSIAALRSLHVIADSDLDRDSHTGAGLAPTLATVAFWTPGGVEDSWRRASDLL